MFSDLNNSELTAIRSCGEPVIYQQGERIFSEGDQADYIYLIESGRISVFVERFDSRETIQNLGRGEWLGEMAIYHNNRRTACAEALEASQMLRVNREVFIDLLATDSTLACKINDTLSRRREELISREKLLDLHNSYVNRHIGIKGDPSLRESALTRQRYESVVDRLMPQLVDVFKTLLLARSAYNLFIGFNSGEIHISTIFDPFGQEFHPAHRLVDRDYLELHFPHVDYAEKARIIRSVYETVTTDSLFSRLPSHLHSGFRRYFSNWKPVPAESLAATLDKLPQLRAIPNFYVRNATIGIGKDAIHLQFNCDGGHILSAEGYRRFLEENL